MSKAIKCVVFLFSSVLFLLFLLPNSVHAAAFNQQLVRVDREQVNLPTGGTICATATTNAPESQLRITFPKNFQVNAAASNWKVNTANLPKGSVPWPGIDTAISVNNRTVFFPSGDLIIGTYYCFNFVSENTLSVISALGEDNLGDIATLASDTSIIDEGSFLISTLLNDQIKISGTVPGNLSDFDYEVNPIYADPFYNENEVIPYRVDYTSHANYAANLSIQVQWTLGTLEGMSVPSLDIVDYYVGSASTGYNQAAPVIDVINKTITWNIKNLPENSGPQQLYFSLKTKKGFRGTYFHNRVNFDVLVRLNTLGVVGPDKKTTQTYISSYYYRKPAFLTHLISKKTPAGYKGLPGIASPALRLEEVSLDSLSSTDALFSIVTNLKSTVVVKYGFDSNHLSSKITDLSSVLNHQIKLSNLLPDTTYYLQIEVKDNQDRVVSELFIFKTASHTADLSTKPHVVLNNLIVTSDKVIVLSPQSDGLTYLPYVLLPKDSNYEMKLDLVNSDQIKQVQIFTRNQDETLDITALSRNVLGISTNDEIPASSDTTYAGQIGEDEFIGVLKSPSEIGKYQIYVKIIDFQGNISEQKLFDLAALKPLTVFAKESNTPIENAKIKLSLYNPKTKLYEDTLSLTQIKDLYYSDSDGSVPFILPQGQYKATISAIGYFDTSIEFSVDPTLKDLYPTVSLQKDGHPLIAAARFYSGALYDLAVTLNRDLLSLSRYNRFFNSIALLSLIILIGLSLLSLSFRMHLSVFYLPEYLWFRCKLLFSKDRSSFMEGIVKDEESSEPIKGATVYIINADKNKLIKHLKTNGLGYFVWRKLKCKQYKIAVVKKGFESTPFLDFTSSSIGEGIITLYMKKEQSKKYFLYYLVLESIELLLEHSFEFLLLISLMIEVIFIQAFGILKMLPFISISLLNAVVWIIYLLHRSILAQTSNGDK